MPYKTFVMDESVRQTLEYDEARVLLLKKAALRAEIQRINASLKKLRCFSPAAAALNKTDAEQRATDVSDEQPDSADTP